MAARRYEEIDRRIGERIELQRKKRGMTQASLGAACRLTPQQIYSHECGEIGMPVGRLLLIAEALEVPEIFFHEEIEDSSPIHWVAALQSKSDRLYLMHLLERLAPSDREQVIAYARILAETGEAIAA